MYAKKGKCLTALKDPFLCWGGCNSTAYHNEPNCASSNVLPGNLLSRKSGSVTGGTGLNLPHPGTTTQCMKTSYISLACGSLNPSSYLDHCGLLYASVLHITSTTCCCQ